MFENKESEIEEEVRVEDHFDRYFGKIVKINLSTGPSLTGELVEIDDNWIAIQKPDGKEISIRKKGVYGIGEIDLR